MNEDIFSFVRKAEERLGEAKYLIDGKMFEASVNRSYYSVLALVVGLLEEREVYAKTHKGLSIKFHELFIKNGELPSETGKILNDLNSLRQESDYEFFIEVSEEEAHDALKSAGNFIDEVKIYLSEGKR